MFRSFLGGIGVVFACALLFFFWDSGWYGVLKARFAAPQESVAEIIKREERTAPEREVRCLGLLVFTEGRTRTADHMLIARSAINYLRLHGQSYCWLLRTGQLVLADGQMKMFRDERAIRLNANGIGKNVEQAAYGNAMKVARNALAGNYGRWTADANPKVTCIERVNRKAGSYSLILRLTRTRSKLIRQFGEPVITGPDGTEFFCS